MREVYVILVFSLAIFSCSSHNSNFLGDTLIIDSIQSDSLSDSKDSAIILNEQAVQLLKQGGDDSILDSALIILDRAILMDSALDVAYQNQITIHYMKSDYLSANQVCWNYLNIFPNSRPFTYQLGLTYYCIGDSEKCEFYLEQVYSLCLMDGIDNLKRSDLELLIMVGALLKKGDVNDHKKLYSKKFQVSDDEMNIIFGAVNIEDLAGC